MKYKSNELNLKKGIEKEWIITNGIGGYSSTTITGVNTRKYHGLLIAPLLAPAKRFLVLSKIDETVEIGKERYQISSNIVKDQVIDNSKYLIEFDKDYIPTYKYKVGGVEIEKSICMVHGENTVIVLYHITSSINAKLILQPLLNLRDFHTINSGHKFEIEQDIEKNKVKVILDNEKNTPIYISTSEGRYEEKENARFNKMFYKEEEKRGFHPEENHSIPGEFGVLIKQGKEKYVTFVCSLEKDRENIDGKNVIKNEINRLKEEEQKIKNNTNITNSHEDAENLVKKYVIATDNFITYRPNTKLHTLMAGFPWFLDRARDSLISIEGIALISKRYDLAKEILLTVVHEQESGLIANGYSGFDCRPLYNSADVSLLLFEAVEKYLKYTDDYKFVKSKIYPTLIKIIEAYKNGIELEGNNIYLDEDSLIVSGTKHTANTWMDAKIGDKIVTPRNGKVVEINAMWYNALKIISKLAVRFGDTEFSEKCEIIADKCKVSFEEKFYNNEKKCLYDVVEDDKLRPNQLFALGLSYPVIDINSVMAKDIFNTVTKKLLNEKGLKSLAKTEEKYMSVYSGDETQRDMSYHQGITWPWLLGIYVDVLEKMIEHESDEKIKKSLNQEYTKLIKKIEYEFIKDMEKGKSIDTIGEIYDSKRPFEAKGATAQCWSVAEIFRIIFKQ